MPPVSSSQAPAPLPPPARADSSPEAVTGPRRLDGSSPSLEALREPPDAKSAVDAELERLRETLKLECEKLKRNTSATVDSAERLARNARSSSPKLRAAAFASAGASPAPKSDLTSKFRALR